MANPTERELIRMRQDAEYDWNTIIRAAERRGEKRGEKRGEERGAEQAAASTRAEMAGILKREGVDPVIISKSSGLSLEEIDAL